MRTRMKSFQFFLLRYLFWHFSPFFLLRQQTFSSMAVCQIFTFFCPWFAVRTLTRILANKQDLPNALPAAAVTNTLGLPTRDSFWRSLFEFLLPTKPSHHIQIVGGVTPPSFRGSAPAAAGQAPVGSVPRVRPHRARAPRGARAATAAAVL